MYRILTMLRMLRFLRFQEHQTFMRDVSAEQRSILGSCVQGPTLIHLEAEPVASSTVLTRFLFDSDFVGAMVFLANKNYKFRKTAVFDP